MKTPGKKPDGEMRPRLESWENTASHLDRFIRPRLGKKLAMEVTKHDIATLSNDIVGASSASPRSATRAICVKGPRACSTGRQKRAATT
ncbi:MULTISPECIES: hypothetical protein [Bradyrhizobium]|uniref:hypothetical protein n=1 Tax=Bradyrhizobium TaxID=374 RepID=UPI001E5D3D7F|nr:MULTISPECIES: hypothetical protein [Bradyrhizobium]UFW50509.1 hypothetical protein BaraCB756_05470 [Bradyrhizobium arachidis]